MTLLPDEAKLFFKLMLALQFFANQKLKVLPEVSLAAKFKKISINKRYEVHAALFKNIRLIDDFIDENPEDFPMKNLAVISKWKNFVAGEFFIERYLKNHAIFVSDENQVYEVLSLTDALDENFPKFVLPVRVKTILLPFQAKIVYDGFLLPYRIVFGGGIKSELKEIYMKAKRTGKIISSL